MSARKEAQRFIDIDDSPELEGTPGKAKFMLGKNLEESSFLPMNVNPVQLKKKIVKKVRFHDDEPIVVPPSQEVAAPKVGTKRVLTRTSELKNGTFTEDSETQNSQKIDENKMLELGEKEMIAMEEQCNKRQKVETIEIQDQPETLKETEKPKPPPARRPAAGKPKVAARV